MAEPSLLCTHTYGPTYIHCIFSGLSWLNGSSILTNLPPGNAEACSKVRMLASTGSLRTAQQVRSSNSRARYRGTCLDSGTCKSQAHNREAAGSSKALPTFTHGRNFPYTPKKEAH